MNLIQNITEKNKNIKTNFDEKQIKYMNIAINYDMTTYLFITKKNIDMNKNTFIYEKICCVLFLSQ